MKQGDIVKVKREWNSIVGKHRKHVLCVALRVTSKDIDNGTNVKKPGLYLFRGYWYGDNPLNHNSYGKIKGNVGIVVGRVKDNQQIKKLGI